MLLETLPFYYGANKIFNNNFIHPLSVIKIDINNLTECINIIIKSIENKEYEKRLKFIKISKKNLINGYNSIPNLINNLSFVNKKKKSIIINDKKFIFERIIFKFYYYTIRNLIFLLNLLYHFFKNYNFYYFILINIITSY